jgi:hypothetical protein
MTNNDSNFIAGLMFSFGQFLQTQRSECGSSRRRSRSPRLFEIRVIRVIRVMGYVTGAPSGSPPSRHVSIYLASLSIFLSLPCVFLPTQVAACRICKWAVGAGSCVRAGCTDNS